jgi:hypothetical protein
VATSSVNRLASQICHNRLFHKKSQQNLLHMISIEVSSLALQRLFEIQIFDPEESDQLPGRVEIPVASGSAQAPDFARKEALLAFDAVRTIDVAHYLAA